MRRENLPDGGHEKVIWRRSRDRSRGKASRQRHSETWWRRTTVMLLGVSFGSYRRRRRDVLNGTSWIRTTETSWWRTTETSLGILFGTYLRRCRDVLMGRRHCFPLRRCRDIPIRPREDIPLRRLATFHWDVVGCVSFETYLQRCWDVQTDVVATSPRRLVAGWAV